jgi:hypothetical protein
MSDLVSYIVNKQYNEAAACLAPMMASIRDRKLNEMKKMLMASTSLDEAARFKIVKARFRGGKLQRRRKVSTQAGFTFRGGKMTRMSPSERRRRKMGQRKGKLKRKATIRRALMKRKRTMRRRKALGL